MLAAFYGLLSLIFVPFMLIFMAVGGLAAGSQGGAGVPALPLMFGMGLGFMILLPVMYTLMGFVFGVISAWLYNMIAKWIGGFEVEFEQEIPPPVV